MPAKHFSLLLVVLATVTQIPAIAQRITPIPGSTSTSALPSLSPDEKTLAFAREDPQFERNLYVRPIDGGKPLRFAGVVELFGVPGMPIYPTWSPDGSQIAYLRSSCHSCPSALYVKGSPQGKERSLGTVCLYPVSWTSDSRSLIGAALRQHNEDCRSSLIPVDGSRRVTIIPNEAAEIGVISPDGRRVAYSAQHRVKVVAINPDYRAEGKASLVAQEPHEIANLHWTPDGHQVFFQVFANGRYYSKLVPSDAQVRAGRLIQLGGNIDVSQILPDGSALGVEYMSRTTLWRMDLNPAGQKTTKIRDLPVTDGDPAVSPDGQLIAFTTTRNGPPQIWVSRLDGSQARILVPAIPPFGSYGDRTGVECISWSPDGLWIAFMTEPGIGHGVVDAKIFLVRSNGGQAKLFVRDGEQASTVPWSPDSKSIYIAQVGTEYKSSYFQVDLATGKRTPVAAMPNPVDVPLPPRSEHPSLTKDGRFVFFSSRPEEFKARMVRVADFLPSAAKP
jgi:Tol biopolymer transport system component